MKLWDIEQGKDRLALKHAEVIQSLSWSADGAYLVTTSRDKKLRFWDVRQEKPAQEVPVRSHLAISMHFTKTHRVIQELKTAVRYGWVNTIVLQQLDSLE